MSGKARRVLTDEQRGYSQAARARADTCGLCGRALAPGETIWFEPVSIGRFFKSKIVYWGVPVGRECASPETLRAADGGEPTPCAGCGRGVVGRPSARPRTVAVCSRRCHRRGAEARAKEKGLR